MAVVAAEALPVGVERPGSALTWLLPPLAFTAAVYYPITKNYFFSDDFLNLYHIADHNALYYLIIPNGGHILVSRNALFLVSWWLFGTEPAYYFWTVLLTHLANVWLLFDIIRRLTASPRVACFGATLFGICPLNEGSLGWYAVYGHVVATTAILVILGQEARLADRHQSPSWLTLCLWYALALVATTSFGVGITVSLMLPIVLFLLLPSAARSWRTWLPFCSLLVVIPVLYFVLIELYSRVSGQLIPMRKWVAQNILPMLGDIPLALFRLVAYAFTRLLFGFVSTVPWYPWLCDALAGLLAIWAFLVAVRSPGRTRRVVAAYALLIPACYGLIAGARVFFVSNASVETMAGNARYHYLGLALLAVLLCVCIARTPLPRRLGSRARDRILIAWLVVTALAYGLVGPHIDHHTAAREQTTAFLTAIDREVAAQPAGEAVYIRNRNFQPLPNYLLTADQFPGWAAAFTIFFPTDMVAGRRVYFVEPRQAVIDSSLRGPRTRGLLVAPAGS